MWISVKDRLPSTGIDVVCKAGKHYASRTIRVDAPRMWSTCDTLTSAQGIVSGPITHWWDGPSPTPELDVMAASLRIQELRDDARRAVNTFNNATCVTDTIWVTDTMTLMDLLEHMAGDA